jgi:hypothetical protein
MQAKYPFNSIRGAFTGGELSQSASGRRKSFIGSF